jgi:hypothetical protein
MPLWYTIPNIITSPLQIDGLIGWYDNNSAQFGPNDFLIRWSDLSSCKNDLVPYYSNIKCNFLFNNAILANESLLNLDTISSGATVFIVADLSNNDFDQSNYVSFFTNDLDGTTQIDNLITSLGRHPGGTNLNVIGIGNSSDSPTFGNIFNTSNREKTLVNSICFNTFYDNDINDATNFLYTAAGYINNSNVTISLSPSNITTDMNNFNVFIGDYSNGRSGHGINTQIFEVLLYNKVLPISDINIINNYLATKYSINLYNNNFIY